MSERPNEWTEDEAYCHLQQTFEQNCREFYDIMKPYADELMQLPSVMDYKSFLAADIVGNRKHNTEVMRRGLRETFKQRWPDACPRVK